MAKSWSRFQRDIFEAVKSGDENLIVMAVAGSGKSTTIVEACNVVRRVWDYDPLFLAFNKAIADDLKGKGVNAATLHSAGMRAWRNVHPKVNVVHKKVFKLIDAVVSPQDRAYYASQLLKLVGYAKQYGIVPGSVNEEPGYDGALGIVSDTEEEWHRMIDHHSVEFKHPDDANVCIRLAREVLKANLDQKTVIDFNDMLYLPVVYCTPFTTYDWIFVDEAQDVSAIQRCMLDLMLTENGVLVAVGDEKQAIYGFRGADSNALALIERDFMARRLPLSITYRCARKIVELAKQFVPEIEARPDAPEGIVQDLGSKFDADTFRPDDLVICRNSAPLVKLAYRLIGMQVPCKVLGRDIGKGLVSLVKALKATSLPDLAERLEQWVDDNILVAEKAKNESKVEQIQDKAECIRVIMDSTASRTVDELLCNIESLFSDDSKDNRLTLCTIHKARGLEAERVFILNRFLMPSKWAKLDWEIQQELNIEYVAYTRAKNELYFITVEGNQRGKAPTTTERHEQAQPTKGIRRRFRAAA